MEAHQNRCLVCDADDQLPLYSLTESFAHHEEFETVRRGVGRKTGGNGGLREQLSVIFLLRRVLRLNKGFLEGTLQRTGTNPSLWNLQLCRACYRSFEEADFVWTRLRKLHEEFEGLCRVLFGKLVKSVKLGNGIKGEIPVEAKPPGRRKPGRKRKAERRKEDLEDEWSSVADKIRREIFTQAKEGFPMAIDSEEFPLFTESSVPAATSISPRLKSLIKAENTSYTRSSLQKVTFPDECIVKQRKIDCSVEKQKPEDGANDMEDWMDSSEPDHLVDNNSDGDNAADLDYNYEGNNSGDDNEELNEANSDSDSDFEPTVVRSIRKRKRISSTALMKRRKEQIGDMGVILKAVKMENSATYACPKCKDVFENASLCDHHILHKHYGGKWPKNFSCHICEDINFKGEYWLRHHYRMRHPGIKWTVDETLQRSIEEGTMPELTYEVIPVGQSMPPPDNTCNDDAQLGDAAEDSSLYNRTLSDPPLNAFSIPVVQNQGQIHYLVLPTAITKLQIVGPQIQTGPAEKACDKCEKRFPTEMQLLAHIKRVHEGETMCYECPLCPKKFERIGKILLHAQRVHMFSKHSCEICGNIFKEEILLKAHVQRVHFGVEYPYSCIKCSIRYPRRSTLNKHLKHVHKLQIASYHLLAAPKKSATAMLKRIKRKKRIKLEKKFPCDICAKKGQMEMKFVSEEELDAHIKRRHMGIARPYPCPICEKRYSKQSIVDKHMNIHTVRSDLHIDDAPAEKAPPLPFVCHPCNKQFRTQCLYNYHLRGRNHQNVRPFVCELCSQGFSGLKYLQNHQSQKHHKELNIVPFKCKFCHQVLSSRRSLNDHIKLRHTKEGSFSCPYCDVQFQHKSNRDTHINALHTKTQHFLCPQCPKTFLRDYYLKNHMQRVHSGTKPYECKFCSKEFSDKSTFNRHVEAHSDIVHSCPHCGKSGFKTRHALRVHQRTFHKELLDEMDRQKKLASLVNVSQASDDSNSVSVEGGETSTENSQMEAIDVKMQVESQQNLSVQHEQLNVSSYPTDSTLNLFL